MQNFYNGLNEEDKEKYVALEGKKLSDGGLEYISTLLNLNCATSKKHEF